MVLGPFAETKGPRRSGTKPRLILKHDFLSGAVVLRKAFTLTPTVRSSSEQTPQRRGRSERSSLKVTVLLPSGMTTTDGFPMIHVGNDGRGRFLPTTAGMTSGGGDFADLTWVGLGTDSF